MEKDSYRVVSKLGQGTFGCVDKIKIKESGEEYACKNSRMHDDEGQCPAFIREGALVGRLDHENIIAFKSLAVDGDGAHFVMPLASMDLHKYIKDNCSGEIPLPVGERRDIMRQLLAALKHCHERGVAHRDVKPGNILLSKDPGTGSVNIQLTDFGQSRAIDFRVRSCSPCVCTRPFRSPEVYLGDTHHTGAMDVWAAGITLIHMHGKYNLINDEIGVVMLFDIFKLVGTPTEETWPGVSKLTHWTDFPKFPTSMKHIRSQLPHLTDAEADLLMKLLLTNPKTRITAAQALRHPFF